MSPAAIALAWALVAAPGIGLSFLLLGPGRTSLPVRLALVVPLGYSTAAVLAFLLGLVHALFLPSFGAVLGVATLAVWLAAIRLGRLRGHLGVWREDLSRDAWILLLGLLVVAVLVPVRFTYGPALNLGDQTPLRYWADGVEVADGRALPGESVQWGRVVPAASSKVLLNAFHGAAALVLGRGPLAPMGALLVVVSIGTLLAAFALAREMGLRWTAPLALLLLAANAVWGPRDLTGDLVTYRGENWGRVLMFGGVLLAAHAFRTGEEERGERRTAAIVAGALFGVAAGTHLVPALVGIVFIVLYGAAWVAARAGRARPVAASIATVVVVGSVLGGAVLMAAPGELGLGGAADPGAYRRIATDLGLPSFDPTRYLALGEVRQPPRPGPFYDPPSAVYHEFVRRIVGEPVLRRPFLVALPLLALAALAAALRWGDPDLKAAAMASFGFAGVLLGAALAFGYVSTVFVTAEIGSRRLFDYPAIGAVLLALAGVESLLRRLAAGAGGRARVPRRIGPVAAWLVAVVAAAVLVPRAVAPAGRELVLEDALGPLAWIGRSVPCEGRILADRRTLATFETMTGHQGVLEGMGPYLRPGVLETAIRELFAARGFFAHPEGGLPYLRDRDIAAVVVTADRQPLGGVGSALKVGDLPTSGLQGIPFLEVAARSRTVTVYRVATFDPGRAGVASDLMDRPGYRCPAA